MTLLILDGNSIVNRAFYGIKLLSTKSGEFTNAIFGFLKILDSLKKEVNPDATAIAFDLRAPTFRHKAYDKYKANRKGMPPELAQQMPKLKEILKALGYTLVEKEGYEADDIIGTIAKKNSALGHSCVIATGDRDSLQLVDDNISVRITATKFGRPQVTMYDKEKILSEYGITPLQLIETKALQGDSSDNIPGVAGIGPKTALALIQKYGNIDYIYKNIDSLEITERQRCKLTAGKDSAFMSHMLGTIDTAVPIDTTIELYLPKSIDHETATRLFRRFELFSMLKPFGVDTSNVAPSTEKEQVAVKPITQEDITAISDIKEIEGYINDSEVYISCSFADDFTVKYLYVNTEGKIFSLTDKTIVLSFWDLLRRSKACLMVNNSKQLFRSVNDISDKVTFDIQLASYLLEPDSKRYDIDRLCTENAISVNIDENIKDFSLVKECVVLPILYKRLYKELYKREQIELLQKIEIPFSEVLASMESEGFSIDLEGIKEYGDSLSDEIDKLQAEIFDYIGYEFNLNSSKQLSKALFEDLGLKKGKKTKSGYSTNAEVLEGLKNDHPCIRLILRYRMLIKLKSTYCDGLVKVVSDDGKIHTTFNQLETRTGRISSIEPNLQNIPVRTAEGKVLRKFFLASEGNVLLDADYSQIELRVLAHIANDENMLSAFNNNEDIHTKTASQVFNLPEAMITSTLRGRAKAVNFGIIYGMGAFSLAKDIGVSVKEAKQYIEGYLEHFKSVDRYMNETVLQAKEVGYVKSLFNRRRYLPELNATNHNLRSFGERVARNMPIQGSAADIIKIASVNVFRRLKDEKLKSKLIMQVHDELIVDTVKEEKEKVEAILKEEMENCVKLNVKLTVDVKSGKTWYDTKE